MWIIQNRRRSQVEWLEHVRGTSDRAVEVAGPHLLAQEEPAQVAQLLVELAEGL